MAERITTGTGMGTRRGVGVGLALNRGAGVGVGCGLGAGVGAAPDSESDCFLALMLFFLVERRGTGELCGCAIESPSFLKNSRIGLGFAGSAESALMGISAKKRIGITLSTRNRIFFFFTWIGAS